MSFVGKWWQTMKISWSTTLAYRLNFFLQIIGPAIVFFFIKYNLWSSIYAQEANMSIRGYDFQGMINYHVWGLIVGLVGQGHASFNLSMDIRMGRISSYLIYPFNFWEFHTASFLAFQCIQVFVSFCTLVPILVMDIIPIPALTVLLNGILFSLFVSFFWYTLQYFCGILAFWMEETWILRVMLSIITAFLSGAIIPLELYPQGFVEILQLTPFPYLTYYPIKVFSGANVNLLNAYLTVGGWILLFALINTFIWKRGIRMYTAAGM